MEAVRKASMPDNPQQRIFAGAGVYTVNEIFHFAGELLHHSISPALFNIFPVGLSPDLTEYGLIRDGSRMARLCLAYLKVSIDARENAWFVLRLMLCDRHNSLIKPGNWYSRACAGGLSLQHFLIDYASKTSFLFLGKTSPG